MPGLNVPTATKLPLGPSAAPADGWPGIHASASGNARQSNVVMHVEAAVFFVVHLNLDAAVLLLACARPAAPRRTA